MTISTRSLSAALGAALLLTCAAQADDGLRIATVDMQTLFKDYHRTNEAQKEINIERARIQQNNNVRLDAIRALEEDLRTMRAQLDDPTISDKRKQDLFKSLQTKSQEGVALDRERREFLQRRQTALNEKMMMKMRGILDEIRTLVRDHAKQEACDYVFDRAGLSTNQVPVLLYAPDATDLTPDLLRKLNKDAPNGSETPDPVAIKP